MKRQFLLLVFILTVAIIITSCDKENKTTLPTVTTLAVTDISHNRAMSGGNISKDGGADLLEGGVVWATTVLPTLEQNDGMTNDSASVGVYESSLTGLTAETKYYVRAFATNIEGVAYGNQLEFTTDKAYLPQFSAIYIDVNASKIDFYVSCKTDDYALNKIEVMSPGGIQDETFFGNGMVLIRNEPIVFPIFFDRTPGNWSFRITGAIKSGTHNGTSFVASCSITVSGK